MGDNFILIPVSVIFLWLIVLSVYLYKTVVHYHRLIGGIKKENLEEILDKIIENIHKEKISVEEVRANLQKLTEESVHHIQKVGILRFNPFADTGGDQSFILAILDGRNTGVVLTSLHSRGITRWYAKNVKEGKGIDHKLSDEEEKAIHQAITLQQK